MRWREMRILLDIDQEIHDKIKALAADEKRTKKAQIEFMLQTHPVMRQPSQENKESAG
jgi:hypothetical protein